MIQAVTHQHPENHILCLLPLLQPLPPSLIPFPSFVFFLLILDESSSKQPPFILYVQTCILSKNPQSALCMLLFISKPHSITIVPLLI